MIFRYEHHPLLAGHPMMDEKQLNDLVENIREHGQQLAIWVWKQYLIDGRNREKACEILGIRPRYADFPGEEADIPWFIEALNFHRKGHSAADRRRLVAELRVAGQTLKEIAKQTGTSQTQVLRDLKKKEREGLILPPVTESDTSLYEDGDGPKDEPIPMVRGNDGKLYAVRTDDPPESIILVDPDGTIHGEGVVLKEKKKTKELVENGREPGDDTEAEAQAYRNDRAARSRNGKPIFDCREWTAAVRDAVKAHTQVRKLLDKRRDAGHSGNDRLGHRACVRAWDACEAAWGTLLASWKDWQK